MNIQSCMPHQLMGYDLDDVEGILMSISIVNEVAKKQEAMAKHPTNKNKSSGRKARMRAKNPGYV
jgi:hypothetical protein